MVSAIAPASATDLRASAEKAIRALQFELEWRVRREIDFQHMIVDDLPDARVRDTNAYTTANLATLAVRIGGVISALRVALDAEEAG
jgi:hypothetical protein